MKSYEELVRDYVREKRNLSSSEIIKTIILLYSNDIEIEKLFNSDPNIREACLQALNLMTVATIYDGVQLNPQILATEELKTLWQQVKEQVEANPLAEINLPSAIEDLYDEIY